MRRSHNRGLSAATDVIHGGALSPEIAHVLRPHMAKVFWDDVVGEQVSGATQVLAIRSGNTLVVRAKSSVWANELSLLKTDILNRLNRAIGGGRVLTDLRFEVGKLDPKPVPEVPDPKPERSDLDAIRLPVDVLQRISKATGGIDDDGLRDKVSSVLTRVAQADAWKREQGWKPCERCGTLAKPSEHRSAHLCSVCWFRR